MGSISIAGSDEGAAFWAAHSPFVLPETTDMLDGGSVLYAERVGYGLHECCFCRRTRRRRHLDEIVIRPAKPPLGQHLKALKDEALDDAMRGDRRQVYWRCTTGPCRREQRRLGYV